MMWPSAYKTDLEKQKKMLMDRYMRLRRNYRYDSSDERYQWVEAATKNRYQTDVNVNNWVEERRDSDYMRQQRCLPSDFQYAYETEYVSRFGDHESVKSAQICKYKCYPGHQPEMVPEDMRFYNKHFLTISADYNDPRMVANDDI